MKTNFFKKKFKKQLPDRNQAYADFKSNEGAEMNATLKQHTAKLKDLKQEAVGLTGVANALKTEIEELKATADRQAGADEETDVADAEREHLYEDIKKKTTAFRDARDTLARLKVDHDNCQKLQHQCRQQLVASFEKWFAVTYCDGCEAPAEVKPKRDVCFSKKKR